MKNIFISFVILFLSSFLTAQLTLEGKWLTGEENSIIETYQKEGTWYGKLISSDNPDAKIGIDILREFQFIDGKWKGKLFAAKKDKILDALLMRKGIKNYSKTAFDDNVQFWQAGKGVVNITSIESVKDVIDSFAMVKA